MGIKIDMPIVLNGVTLEDSYEGEYVTRRAIIYTLDFTSKVYFYPNIKGTGFGDYSEEANVNLIRTAITNFQILSRDQVAALTSPLLLETSTPSNSNAILLETGTDKLIYETRTSGLDKSRVKSVIKSSIAEANVDPAAVFDQTSVVDEKFFYDEGREYNPITGTYID